MVKNICFDVGNVVIDYQPGAYLEKLGFDAEKREAMLKHIFWSEEWRKLDNGDITFEEAADIISEKSTLTREEILETFDLLPGLLFPMEENIALLPKLKEKGYKLFYISNFTVKFFYMIKAKYPFFGLFDDGVISADLRLSKPGEEIYTYAFDKFSILPEESLFIDDTYENIVTADLLGMKTIHLKYGDSLEKRFIGMGIL